MILPHIRHYVKGLVKKNVLKIRESFFFSTKFHKNGLLNIILCYFFKNLILETKALCNCFQKQF